ncbi:hypothetical protein RAA17_23230 [Komagataeibacter rhaeticus]|nr:hypothetical protein [Komagataeibacter rhaeticus]
MGHDRGRAIRFPVVTFQERIARSVHRLLYLLLGKSCLATWRAGQPAGP